MSQKHVDSPQSGSGRVKSVDVQRQLLGRYACFPKIFEVNVRILPSSCSSPPVVLLYLFVSQ